MSSSSDVHHLLQDARRYRPWSVALYDALAPDPFYQALEAAVPDREKRKSAMLSYYDYSLAEAARFGRLSCSDREVPGAAAWALPLEAVQSAEKTALKSSVLQAAMGPAAVALYKSIGESMSVLTAPHVTPADWYLSILGLAPGSHGQGIGAQLIHPTLKEAAAAGAATYLESFTPGNLRFYEKHGYRAVVALEEPILGRRYWVLRRPAS